MSCRYARADNQCCYCEGVKHAGKSSRRHDVIFFVLYGSAAGALTRNACALGRSGNGYSIVRRSRKYIERPVSAQIIEKYLSAMKISAEGIKYHLIEMTHREIYSILRMRYSELSKSIREHNAHRKVAALAAVFSSMRGEWLVGRCYSKQAKRRQWRQRGKCLHHLWAVSPVSEGNCRAVEICGGIDELGRLSV